MARGSRRRRAGPICLAVCSLALWVCGPGKLRAETLFAALGGQAGVAHLTSEVLDSYMADPRLQPYFDNINPAWLKPRLASHLCKFLGGGCLYRGRAMGAAHRGLHIDQAAFDAAVEDTEAVMVREGIGYGTQNRLLARLAPLERDIVSR